MTTPISGLLLAPGAGAGRDQPALVAVDQAVSTLGILVERIDFPYRVAGRKRPDPPHVLLETVTSSARALARRAVAERAGAEAPQPRDGDAPVAAGADTSALVLGGRSLGGRICSMAVAAGLPAAGLVLVSYPLHPPGRPEKLRSDHFRLLDVPCLFLSGRRDSFASVAELESAAAAIVGPVTHIWVEGDHSLRRRDEEVASVVAAWIAALMT